jgi:C-terminal processing protease CtpA/Prc
MLKQLFADRNHPAIVLCNRETAGPFEALLSIMQQQGTIIAVGERTAGKTGFYHNINPQTWMIQGELRPQSDVSLVATGFTPRIQIKVTAEENYSSYHLYEAGTPITRLLRQERNLTNTEYAATEDASIERDRILQRGVDIATALQVLYEPNPSN